MGAQGTATLNFGSFPGAVEAQVDVTGQTGLTSANKIEAWVFPVATADHSADEHLVERLQVLAVFKQNDQFTIRGFDNASPAWRNVNLAQPQRLYGQWTIGWVWN